VCLLLALAAFAAQASAHVPTKRVPADATSSTQTYIRSNDLLMFLANGSFAYDKANSFGRATVLLPSVLPVW
jgi:hypothetical protein